MRKPIILIVSYCLLTIHAYPQWSWRELGGLDALSANWFIETICSDQVGNIYAAGYFSDSSNNCFVAKWDGNQWSQLGAPNGAVMNAGIHSICADTNGNIYAGGDFTNSSWNRYVAKWDGINWNELGGFNSITPLGNYGIYSVCTDHSGNIYTAGDFSMSSYRSVAKWNGAAWSELGGANSLLANGSILSLCSDAAGNIFAAGGFTNSSGKRYVAKYDGTSWTELGGLNALSANNNINSICSDLAGNIYAGGTFTNTQGSGWTVFKYDGNTWTALVSGSNWFNNVIWSVCTDAVGNVYCGGAFHNNSGFQYVAKWDGSNWNAMGPANGSGIHFQGIIKSVYVSSNGSVYTAGKFTNANSHFYVAVYADETSLNSYNQENEIQLTPNPVSEFITIHSKNYQVKEVSIFDIHGKMLLNDKIQEARSQTINLSNLSPGLYFVRLKNDSGVTIFKIMKE